MKKQYKKMMIIMVSLGLLTACQREPVIQSTSTHENIASTPVVNIQSINVEQVNKIIDWKLIETGEKAIPTNQFKYPFELDSEPVKAYAEMYKLDKQTAQHNLTIGMAVNEVLSKLLDQIGTAYVSHELTTDKPSKFIIHTTKTIQPSKHQYVFAEPYAKGLTIDVEIINDGNKNDIKIDNPHASSPKN